MFKVTNKHYESHNHAHKLIKEDDGMWRYYIDGEMITENASMYVIEGNYNLAI